MSLGVGEAFLSLIIIFLIISVKFGILVAFSVLIVGTSVYIWRLYESKQYWKRQNVPGPKTNLLIGNAMSFHGGLHTIDLEWRAQFGPTYGSFLFNSPELTSSDVNLLREVLVKQFACFEDRVNLLNIDPKDPTSLLANSLVSLRGETWRHVRNKVAPAFSTSRVKRMVPTFNECSQLCMEILREHAHQKTKVDIRDVSMRLMMDLTARAAFGRDFDVQRDGNSEFVEFARQYSLFDFRSPRLAALTLFPNICRLLKDLTGFSVLNQSANQYFLNILEDVLNSRLENKEQYVYDDFFQILIDSMDKKAEEDSEIGYSPDTIAEGKLKREHILGQAFMFILAGFETGPIVLHLFIYLLAMHPIEQDRCRDEVKRVCGDKPPDYASLSQLRYVDQCFNEAMRLYPPVVRTNRVCTKATTVDGIKLKEGCIFSIPIWNIHHSEEYYDEPEKFKPERWDDDAKTSRDPLLFLPFGYGPRNCIGMRVGQLQVKSAVAHLLQNFRISVSPGSPNTLPLRIDTRGSMRTEDRLFIDVVPL